MNLGVAKIYSNFAPEPTTLDLFHTPIWETVLDSQTSITLASNSKGLVAVIATPIGNFTQILIPAPNTHSTKEPFAGVNVSKRLFNSGVGFYVTFSRAFDGHEDLERYLDQLEPFVEYECDPDDDYLDYDDVPYDYDEWGEKHEHVFEYDENTRLNCDIKFPFLIRSPAMLQLLVDYLGLDDVDLEIYSVQPKNEGKSAKRSFLRLKKLWRKRRDRKIYRVKKAATKKYKRKIFKKKKPRGD
jgi:hypothetical protein